MALFAGRKIKAFAEELATSIEKRYPPAIDANPAKRVSENRLTRVLEETLARAEEFQSTNRLGMFGKAKLGNEFKWRLKEMGYTDPFIEVATEGLMVALTRGLKPSPTAGAEKR